MKRRFRNLDKRNSRIEKPDHRSHQAAFGLSFFAEEQHVVRRQQGNVYFRDDCMIITDDAWIKFFTCGQHADEIVMNFLFNRFALPTGVNQFSEDSGPSSLRIVHKLEFNYLRMMGGSFSNDFRELFDMV